MEEAERCELEPVLEETREGPWRLVLSDEDAGMVWTFKSRLELAVWLNLALKALQDG